MFFEREKSLSSAGKCSSKGKNLFRVRENVLRNGKISFKSGKISFELRKNLFQIKEKSLANIGKSQLKQDYGGKLVSALLLILLRIPAVSHGNA